MSLFFGLLLWLRLRTLGRDVPPCSLYRLLSPLARTSATLFLTGRNTILFFLARSLVLAQHSFCLPFVDCGFPSSQSIKNSARVEACKAARRETGRLLSASDDPERLRKQQQQQQKKKRSPEKHQTQTSQRGRTVDFHALSLVEGCVVVRRSEQDVCSDRGAKVYIPFFRHIKVYLFLVNHFFSD